MIVGGRFQNFRHVWSLLAPALSCPIVVHVCAVNSLPPPRRRISGSRRMRVSLPSISVQIDYLDACEVRPERAPFVLPTTDALLPSDSSSSTPIRLSCCSAGHVASLAHTGTTSSMSDTAVGVSTALVFVNAMASQPRAPPSISPISHAIGGALSLLMRRAASYWLRAARPEENAPRGLLPSHGSR